jgi:hypothetical protein
VDKKSHLKVLLRKRIGFGSRPTLRWLWASSRPLE